MRCKDFKLYKLYVKTVEFLISSDASNPEKALDKKTILEELKPEINNETRMFEKYRFFSPYLTNVIKLKEEKYYIDDLVIAYKWLMTMKDLV